MEGQGVWIPASVGMTLGSGNDIGKGKCRLGSRNDIWEEGLMVGKRECGKVRHRNKKLKAGIAKGSCNNGIKNGER